MPNRLPCRAVADVTAAAAAYLGSGSRLVSLSSPSDLVGFLAVAAGAAVLGGTAPSVLALALPLFPFGRDTAALQRMDSAGPVAVGSADAFNS